MEKASLVHPHHHLEQSQDHAHSHPHSHPHSHNPNHTHAHGAIDPEIVTSDRGIWAVKWSFVGLLVTAIVQAIIFWLSDSVALLADLIHNLGDTVTTIPLGIAFFIARWKPTPRFSYGYGRAEDLAGVAIVALIFVSVLVTGYESVERFLHPHPLSHVAALCLAALIGFIGNETVAWFRIRVGKEIASAALIADGYHARADGFISLSVILSALGSSLGYSWIDPTIGLVITLTLLKIVWESSQTIFTRLLDGVDPDVISKIQAAISPVIPTQQIKQIQARWMGHKLYIAVTIALDSTLSVAEGGAIVDQIEHQIQSQLPYLSQIAIQVHPLEI